MEKDSTSINHNNYYGMVFQNCNMSNATIQTINTPTAEMPARPHTRAKDASLPDELDTPQAHALLGKLVQAGLADEQWQPVGLSLAKQGVLASLLSERLGIAHTWATFGALWGISPGVLRTKYNDGMNQKQMIEFISQLTSTLQ